VTGLPMSWFVGKDGENIGGQPGYIPPDMLLPLLKYIHTDSYKQMNFKTFMKKS
jgi:thioredoxin-related protein